jgi:hypothetical protein
MTTFDLPCHSNDIPSMLESNPHFLLKPKILIRVSGDDQGVPLLVASEVSQEGYLSDECILEDGSVRSDGEIFTYTREADAQKLLCQCDITQSILACSRINEVESKFLLCAVGGFVFELFAGFSCQLEDGRKFKAGTEFEVEVKGRMYTCLCPTTAPDSETSALNCAPRKH